MEKGYLEKNHDRFANAFYCLRQEPGVQTIIRAHYHDEIEFLFGDDDCDLTVWIDGITYNLKSGDFIVIRPFETHSIIAESKKSPHYVIRFSPEMLKYKGQSISHMQYFLPLIDTMSKCERIISKADAIKAGLKKEFKAVVEEYEKKEFGYEVAVHQGIMRLALFAIRHWRSQSTEEALPARKRTVAIIRKAALEATQNILEADEKEAAQKCYMSYSYFSRTFKKIIGMSYSDYVTTLKLRMAQRLLLTTEKSVSEIAALTGFSSASHFITHFKRHYEKTPYAYKGEFKEKFD